MLWLSLYWNLSKFQKCPGLWLQSLYCVWIWFIDSMSLCGFLMDLLGLRPGPLCCISLTGPGTVFRLCLESVHLSFTNFLFLQYIPPALVCTLYVLLLITSIIMALAQFLALGALIECRLDLQSLTWVELLNSCYSVLLVGASSLASLSYVFVCVLVAVI